MYELANRKMKLLCEVHLKAESRKGQVREGEEAEGQQRVASCELRVRTARRAELRTRIALRNTHRKPAQQNWI